MSTEQIVRQHCAGLSPKELVSLPARQLIDLMDARDGERRRANALQEHLKRCHGCDCDQGCQGAS